MKYYRRYKEVANYSEWEECTLQELENALKGWYLDIDFVIGDMINGVFYSTPFSQYKIEGSKE